MAIDQTSSQIAQAKARYARILKRPKRGQAFVEALDEAVVERNKARAQTKVTQTKVI